MNRILPFILMLLALASGGCSTLKTVFGQGGESPRKPSATVTAPLPPKSLTAHLSRARELIQTGKDEAARDLLQRIGTEKSLPGVTDEALFRQGLLTLKSENEAGGYPQTRQILERLIHDYPGSIWAVQATPLNDILLSRWQTELSLGKARRQIKTLKDSNLSLNRENKEMHLNIEKLKTLEQELELKSRRK